MARKPSRNGRSAASKEKVHVGLLIDESGSMAGKQEPVVNGINGFVEALRADEADATVVATLSMFDLNGNEPIVRPKFKAIPIDEVAPLGAGDYVPRGMTPLNDAVIKTIRGMSRAVRKGDRAMLVIITDGLENASEAPSSEVRKLILAKEQAGWEFIYLGANQDAWAESEKIGLAQAGKSLAWSATRTGTMDALGVSAERAKSFRDDPERYKAELSDVARNVDEEKRRRKR